MRYILSIIFVICILWCKGWHIQLQYEIIAVKGFDLVLYFLIAVYIEANDPSSCSLTGPIPR